MTYSKLVLIAGLFVSLLATACAPLGAPRTQGTPSQVSERPAATDFAEKLKALELENTALKARLERLEPEAPQWIIGPQYDGQALLLLSRSHLTDVIKNGKTLPFVTIEHNETWVAPQYVPEWHSTSLHALPIANLVSTNKRRFHVVGGADGRAITSLERAVGLESREDWTRPEPKLCGAMPEYRCYQLGEDTGSWRIYSLAASISEVRKMDNLIVFVVNPNLRGYEIAWLDGTTFRSSSNAPTHFWVAFATPDGAVWDAFLY